MACRDRRTGLVRRIVLGCLAAGLLGGSAAGLLPPVEHSLQSPAGATAGILPPVQHLW